MTISNIMATVNWKVPWTACWAHDGVVGGWLHSSIGFGLESRSGILFVKEGSSHLHLTWSAPLFWGKNQRQIQRRWLNLLFLISRKPETNLTSLTCLAFTLYLPYSSHTLYLHALFIYVLLYFFRGILKIHPSFRIIAIAEPPNLSSTSGQWLNAEILSMFLFHSMTPLPIADEVKVVDTLTHDDITEKLFEVSESLRQSKDPTVSLRSFVAPYSAIVAKIQFAYGMLLE